MMNPTRMCPSCRNAMPTIAPSCPTCGFNVAAAHTNIAATEGQKLVRLSTKLALLGVVLMMGGCGVGLGAHVPTGLLIGMVLGILVLVAAAIVGSIGRARQGRL